MKTTTAAVILASLAPSALAQQLCDQFGNFAASGYNFNNNMWGKDSGSGSQCLNIASVDGSGTSWSAKWDWSGAENQVKSYPYSGIDVAKGRLVSDIGSMPTAVSWSYDNQGINADVAYDLFTAADPNHVTYSGDFELMIWLGKLGNIYPIGQSTGTVNVAGQDWELWDGFNGAMHTYSFVAPSPLGEFSGDVKAFYQFLTDNKGFPASQQYLLNYQFGTEPFSGSANFNVAHWSASIA